jgi:hypothetical protein
MGDSRRKRPPTTPYGRAISDDEAPQEFVDKTEPLPGGAVPGAMTEAMADDHSREVDESAKSVVTSMLHSGEGAPETSDPRLFQEQTEAYQTGTFEFAEPIQRDTDPGSPPIISDPRSFPDATDPVPAEVATVAPAPAPISSLELTADFDYGDAIRLTAARQLADRTENVPPLPPEEAPMMPPPVPPSPPPVAPAPPAPAPPAPAAAAPAPAATPAPERVDSVQRELPTWAQVPVEERAESASSAWALLGMAAGILIVGAVVAAGWWWYGNEERVDGPVAELPGSPTPVDPQTSKPNAEKPADPPKLVEPAPKEPDIEKPVVTKPVVVKPVVEPRKPDVEGPGKPDVEEPKQPEVRQGEKIEKVAKKSAADAPRDPRKLALTGRVKVVARGELRKALKASLVDHGYKPNWKSPLEVRARSKAGDGGVSCRLRVFVDEKVRASLRATGADSSACAAELAAAFSESFPHR